jgi:hypothetical protein
MCPHLSSEYIRRAITQSGTRSRFGQQITEFLRDSPEPKSPEGVGFDRNPQTAPFGFRASGEKKCDNLYPRSENILDTGELKAIMPIPRPSGPTCTENAIDDPTAGDSPPHHANEATPETERTQFRPGAPTARRNEPNFDPVRRPRDGTNPISTRCADRVTERTQFRPGAPTA